MAGYTVKSSEELKDFVKNHVIEKGDVIIHRCPLCGRWVLRRHRWVPQDRKETYYSMNCQKCKTELVYLYKFGTKHPFADKQFRENFLYKGMENKYGKGIKHAHQVPELHQKAYETTKKNFNSDHPFSCDKMIEKYKSGNMKKYGVEWSLQSPEVKAKADKSMLEIYGVKNLFYSKEFQDKIKERWKTEYGVDNVSQIPETRIKTKQTLLERTGHDFVSINKFNYYNMMFDSKPELAVWIYCIDHNISIIRNPCRFEYIYNYTSHIYHPDFMVDGELIEIKGDQYLDKETGKWIFPYNKLHHDSNKLTKEEKEYYDGLYEAKHQCALVNNVKILYEKDIQQYINYCNQYYPNWDIIYRKDNIYNPSYWCYYINNTYIPNYYNNSNYNKGIGISPYDIDKDSEYTICKDSKGISPFYINKNSE